MEHSTPRRCISDPCAMVHASVPPKRGLAVSPGSGVSRHGVGDGTEDTRTWIVRSEPWPRVSGEGAACAAMGYPTCLSGYLDPYTPYCSTGCVCVSITHSLTHSLTGTPPLSSDAPWSICSTAPGRRAQALMENQNNWTRWRSATSPECTSCRPSSSTRKARARPQLPRPRQRPQAQWAPGAVHYSIVWAVD